MTEICFDGMASDGDRGAVYSPANSSGPYAKVIGVGLAAALSTTAIFTLMHRDAFRHSSWGGVVAAAASGMRSVATALTKDSAPAAPAKAVPAVVLSARVRRTARHSQDAAEGGRLNRLPYGLGTVEIARSARLPRPDARQTARAGESSGMHDVGIGRSTRLALAEPAPPKALIRSLEAARPAAPAVSPAERAALVARLERATVAQSPAGPVPVPPEKAPAAPAPQQALDVPLPKIRPVETASLEAAPAGKAPGPQPSPQPSPQVAEAVPAANGPALPDSAPLPSPPPRRIARATTAGSGPTRGPQPSSPRYQLAYASPETTKSESDAGGGFLSHIFGSGRSHLPGVGSGVAVYSIRDATVYMPNGEKLEAHSGMGRMTDKPRYADEKMRGPTPPNVYKLTLRKHLFHGVRAVRMLPADGHNKFGRDGFLAHTYMLRGRPGESNGCVVFKNYAKFLRAFEAGRVRRMVVVPDLSHLPTQIAAR